VPAADGQAVANADVLQPYVRRSDPGPITRFMVGSGLIVVAAFYGLLCSILPMQLIIMPAVPLMLLAALCLWMLPDIGEIDTRRAGAWLMWFLSLFALWPNYVAFDFPGLPWITPVRVALAVVVISTVLGLSMSAWWRRQIWQRVAAAPVLARLFVAYWACTTVSLVFSSTPSFSINKYINNQIFWSMLFFLSVWFGSRAGYITKVTRFMVGVTFVTALVGIYEARSQSVFWLYYLPPFLQVDPEILERIASAQARAGTDVYRVRGTMAVSLYFAEYLAMLFPLVWFFVAEAKGMRKLAMILGAMATMVVMYETNARSAMVGILLTAVIYPFFIVWRARQRNPTSVTSSAGVFSYPAAMLIVTLLVIFWRRAHVMILGGGQHQASSDARGAQWASGWPKVFSHPLGHGVARSGEVLGYTNLDGELTIDTYYLSILLDYGLIALPIFIALFGMPMWYGYKVYMKSESSEEDLAIPLAIGLFNFVVIKSVLSSEGNIPLAFTFLGFLIALMWRQRQDNPVGKVAASATAIPSVPAHRPGARPAGALPA
jgi:O-Antigen ligase